MNPFISLAGVFVTFLAFYIQYKANQNQIAQFKIELEKEKDSEKKEYYYYLSLLQSILGLIINDFEKKIDSIREYYEKQKSNNNLEIHKLIKLPIKNYIDKGEIDKLMLYKSFKTLLFERKDWLEKYIQLYEILTHFNLNKEIDKIYSKHTNNGITQTLEGIEYHINTFTTIYYSYSKRRREFSSLEKDTQTILEKTINNCEKWRNTKLIMNIENLFHDFMENINKYPHYLNGAFPPIQEMKKSIENIKEIIPKLEKYINNDAIEMEKEYKKLINDESDYTKLQVIKLMFDTELPKIETKLNIKDL
ncbi:MAG: hypothetical protein MUC49_06235 [Raineya sp.]|nr:hypothetical protein [Raineya sp.]